MNDNQINDESKSDSYVREFEKYGFGLFIHWGLYSLMETGEWVKKHHQIPHKQYVELKNEFTAKKFTPEKIVKFAQKSGMNYICLTTRHHDGFSLYDTRGLSDFDAPHSVADRDLIAEFAAACHKMGMPMFFYHTTIDWHVDLFKEDWSGYLQYLRDSVEILCQHYGQVDGFWFDGNWEYPEREWEEDKLYGLVRDYFPEAIIVNNTSTGALGETGHPEIDTLTFEQGQPGPVDRAGQDKYLACEMCETINSHWGTARHDYSYKSPQQIIKTLTRCRRYGANLLLNIGLKADGSIPQYEKASFPLVGRWIDKCGQSLYRGQPVEDLTCRGQDFILRQGKDYYYYAHDLAIDKNEHLAGVESGEGLKTVAGKLPEVEDITWVDNNENLEFVQDCNQEMLTFKASKNPYGTNYIVRVAKIKTK
ncbi:MAG: alpha-L-fucosidase [Halanaerobiaceae bacterium]